MVKIKHPVKFFCPSITINPLIHPPSFRLSFFLDRIIFAVTMIMIRGRSRRMKRRENM
jgi:hypothetical protein